MKDYFSTQAEQYARFRPDYPEDLYLFLFKQVNHFDKAWDCACGNGQVAKYLADHFLNVNATDISQRQMDHATKKTNITYDISTAESTIFPNDHFDLITVAQAIHWFNFDKFFKEARRVLKPGGTLAVWGYALMRVENEIDMIIDHLYSDILGDYWSAERKHVEKSYQTIPFPFKKSIDKNFQLKKRWTIDHVFGYLNTWSGARKYIQVNGLNPIDLIEDPLRKLWPKGTKEVTFPIFLKLIFI